VLLRGNTARRLICAGSKRHPLTGGEQGTVVLRTAVPVVDPVAVADTQAVLGAKQPNRLLHQAREECRAIRTELADVDVLGGLLDDAGAPPGP
jgi:hypothetical protein